MKKEVTNYERMDTFNLFNNEINPFLLVTTKVDITNLYKKGKPYYPLIGYFILMTANKINNFKYRYEEGKIYYYDNLDIEFTDILPNKNLGFYTCKSKENYKEFLEEYNSKKEIFLTKQENILKEDQGEIWVTCTPWFKMESLIVPFTKQFTQPQFIWDKFSVEEGKCYINLTIMAHHGFIDGYHIHLFLSEFNKIIENIDKYL